MDAEVIELRQQLEALIKENAELTAFKLEFSSAKQSFSRMSARLRKLCKRLTPTNDVVLEMQKIADDIRELTKTITSS